MRCYVYKGSRKSDHYLYLAQELNERVLAGLPPMLVEMLGELTLVVDFDLDGERTLAQADAAQVISSIEKQGFYLQMPNKDMLAEEEQFFN